MCLKQPAVRLAVGLQTLAAWRTLGPVSSLHARAGKASPGLLNTAAHKRGRAAAVACAAVVL